MKRFTLPINLSNAAPNNPQSPHGNQSTEKSKMLSGISFNNMKILKTLQASAADSVGDISRMSSMKSLFTHHDDRQEDKKESNLQNMAGILKILEDIRLQPPNHHNGLVVAYSAALLSPIINKGIKFTWYRLGSESHFNIVDESFKSWYAPTVDDIGCKICVQCEDNYNEGLSRYVECDPLVADPMICSLLETSLANSFYEARDVNVSMGLKEYEEHVGVHDVEKHQNDPTTDTMNTIYDQKTTLHTDNQSFLQFNGHSAINVDSKGLFISIPVQSITSNTKTSKTPFRVPSRGLRIAPSEYISVHCAQIASVIVTVPTKSQGQLKAQTTENEINEDVDPSMKSFLSSATLTIPWIYEGVHSPEVMAAGRDVSELLSEEEREKRIKEAEDDSVNFANMVVSLTEFISSLPESTKEIKICISCRDRLQRDMLACTIRALVCQAAGTTNAERLKMFPWLTEKQSIESDIESPSTVDLSALRQRLKQLEEENFTLKRERNELLVQIMEEREANIRMTQQGIRSSNATNQKSSDVSSTEHITSNDQTTTTAMDSRTASIDKSEESLINHQGIEDRESYRKLTAKVIELENKLNIFAKKEADEIKFRSDLESRNAQIIADNEKLQKVIDDQLIQLTLIKHERDRSEVKANAMKEKLETSEMKQLALQKDIRDLKSILDSEKVNASQMDSLLQQLEYKNSVIATYQIEKNQLSDQITELKQSHGIEIEKYLNTIKSFDVERQQFDEERKISIKQISILSELNVKQSKDLQELPSIRIELEKAESEIIRLKGELNHIHNKAESQARDLKKSLTESAVVLAEYEKALVRKSEECNDLHNALYMYQSNGQQSMNTSTTSIFKGLSLPIRPSIKLDDLKQIITSQLAFESNHSNESLKDNLDDNI